MINWVRKAFRRTTVTEDIPARAAAGDPAAQFRLGVWHIEGANDCPVDTMKAAAWFKRAAENGHADARYNLAVLYSAGKGVPKDYRIAVHWLRLAAEQGGADAQFLLGKLCSRGKGTNLDLVEACKWLYVAAAQEQPEAPPLLQELEPQLLPERRAEARRRAEVVLETLRAQRAEPGPTVAA